jgi:putative transposase
MAYRRVPFVPGEWYHCFTRGVDKRVVFETEQDFRRFTELLYLANSTDTIDRGRIQHLQHDEIFAVPRGEAFVRIGAYCLMGNHPHLLLQENKEGGVSKFMHKILTGYTMYFNIKRKRVGNLFITPFRSKHIDKDVYLKRVVQYIHLNPAEIFEPQWKQGELKNFAFLERKLLAYPYSSAQDYFLKSPQRPEVAILDSEARDLLKEAPSFQNILVETQEYYKQIWNSDSD